MKLLCLIAIASMGIPAAMAPPFARARDSSVTETAAVRDAPVVGAIPETGGQDLSLPAGSLLLIASVLLCAALRRRGRL